MTGIRCLACCALLTLALALIGCGRKTDPVPPQAAIPAPIDDLSYQFLEAGVVLEWTYPRKSKDGREIGKVRQFILYKSDLADEEYCHECPATVTSVRKIDPRSIRLGQKVRIKDTHLVPGHHYAYSVVAHCGWNITSQKSNRISFWWDTPPAAPSSVRAEQVEEKVKISWAPVERNIKGDSLGGKLSYQIFGKDTGAFKLLGNTPGSTSYYDQLPDGDSYKYQIRAVNLFKGTSIPGPYSQVVFFTPVDRTPPPVPEIVSIIHTRQGPRILWERISAPDLGGYRVYRRQNQNDKWNLIVETGPKAFSFVDESLTDRDREQAWHYTITSVDQASPTNESDYGQGVRYEGGKL